MTSISLIVRFPETGKDYLIKLDTDLTVEEFCNQIRLRIPEANTGNPSHYGIFVADPDPKHSFWLEGPRMLSYYHLAENFEVEYRFKMRLLVIQTMDGTRKTLQVDDSKTVAELMNTICTKMGITNHEEYSLIRQLDEEEKMRTLTLRKKKGGGRDTDRWEKMKQKLNTDDDLNWLAHGKTLRQHGVEETEVLILKRKYFFADQNVGTRDPVQLNLLYLQLKEAIINGKHPISMDQAIQLAALQCQAETGVYTAEKAKHNPIDVKDHLPQEYRSIRNIDKRIQEYHKTLDSFDEREAKLQYVKLCRSLPTYGITFFLIKEKLKGRNKLVPRLFGVSKESVMRVDEKTKEILETWPLTQVRRWAAGTNLFTLDLGDYHPGGNFAMKTTEGEQIAQLISGYVDIILRRQRSRQAALNEEDEGNAIVEENMAPSRANVISNVHTLPSAGHKTGEAQFAEDGTLGKSKFRGSISEGHLATREHAIIEQHVNGGQLGHGRIVNRNGIISEMNGHRILDAPQPKRTLLSRIDTNLKTIQEATEELDAPIYSDDEALRGDDGPTKLWRAEALEHARHGVYSHLGAMTMATGQLVSCLQSNENVLRGDEYDYTSMDASLVSIGMNVNSLMQCIRLYDQLEAAENASKASSGDDLKHAAQLLSAAFLDLVKSARPLSEEDQPSSPLSDSTFSLAANGPDRAALLEAAGRVGDASRQLLQLIGKSSGLPEAEPMDRDGELAAMSPLYPPVVDWEARDRLLSATKWVANRMADMVKIAKSGALALGEELVHSNATDSSQPILRAAQSRLVHAATTAGKSASRLVTCAKVVVCTMEQPESQDQLLRAAKEVSSSANGVTEAIDELTRASLDFETMEGNTHESHLRLGDSLHEAVQAVHAGISDLINCLQAATVHAHQDPVVSTLMSVASQLPASIGDGQILIEKSRSLAAAATQLAEEMLADCGQMGLTVGEANRRAAILQTEVERLNSVAHECANGNVQSLEHQQRLVEVAQQVFTVAQATTAPIIRARLTQGLEFATRLTASNVGPLVTVGGEVIRISQGQSYRLASTLDQLQKQVMPEVNRSCSDARVEPFNTQKQGNLLDAARHLARCLEDMLRNTDALVPTIPDPAIQTAFTGATRNTQACLTDLRLCLNNYEPILNSPPPAIQDQTDQDQDSELRLATMDRGRKSLDLLYAVLQGDNYRLLPDETLDSVCVALWNAISRFNHSFPPLETTIDNMDSRNGYPSIIRRLSESSAASGKDWSRVSGVVLELIERLTPLVNGVRGLAALLSTASTAPILDKDLSRVLLVSHGLVVKRQSSTSGRSSLTEPVNTGSIYSSQEDQAQSTAGDMLEHLVAIGQACLGDASQLIGWALQPGAIAMDAEDTHQMAVVAEQLSTSVNAMLGYIPGEVVVRRMIALIEDKTNSGLPYRGEPQSPKDPSSAQESYGKLSVTARQLAKACLEVSSRISNLSRRSSKPSDTEAFGWDSRIAKLAGLADRVAGSLAELIRATMSVTERMPVAENLNTVALPVAIAFRQAMRSGGDVRSTEANGMMDVPSQDNKLQQVLQKMREWAADLAVESDNRQQALMEQTPVPAARQSTRSVEEALVARMRTQCEASLRRVNALVQVPSAPAGKSHVLSQAPNPIRVPPTSHTFPECLTGLGQLNEDIKTQTDTIPTAAAKKDASSFCAAIQALAQSTCETLQLINQSAYLVGAAHPSSKPGRIGPLSESEQLTLLHDHIAAVRRGTGELGRIERPLTAEGIPSTEVMNIATNVTQHATQLCQSTRSLLNDCKPAGDRRLLTESLERIARTAAALFSAIHVDRSKDPSLVSRQLRSGAAMLDEAVDLYSEVLLRCAGGSPTQLAEEALTLQTPLLDSGQCLLANSSQLIEVAHNLIAPDPKQAGEVKEMYKQTRHGLLESMDQLMDVVTQLTPGWEACAQVTVVVKQLINEVDEAALNMPTSEQITASNSGRLEASINLIRSNLEQLNQLASETTMNWDASRWELVAHNVYAIGNYLPNLIRECVQSASRLSDSSDQSTLLSFGRTVLEAAQELTEHLANRIRESSSAPTMKAPPPISEYTTQFQQACKDLLVRVDGIAKLQGGIAWHLASINTACAKLDDLNTVNGKASTEDGIKSHSTNLISAQARVCNQLRGLAEAANRVSQAHAQANKTDPSVRANAVASMAQLFVQLVDTTQIMLSALAVCDNRSDGNAHPARRLCNATQALGAACSDYLRAPLHPDRHKTLKSRSDDLKAILQSCAPGADACATAAADMNGLVAELDSAVIFARAGTLADPLDDGQPRSLKSKTGSFQASQDSALATTKELVEDIQTLIKSSASDPNALAISARNCFLRASDLTQLIKSTTARAARDLSGSESSIESQVQLLTAARDVMSGLILSLNQSKSVTATKYAVEALSDTTQAEELMERQKTLNDSAIRLVEHLSRLSQAIRSLGNLVQSAKPTVAPRPLPKRPTQTRAKEANPEKNSVRNGLQSIVDALKETEKRLSSWKVENGRLIRPYGDYEDGQNESFDTKPSPQQLVQASRAITQAAIKANSATASGNLSEISQAAHTLRKVAEDLTKTLSVTCENALSSVLNGCIEEDADSGLSSESVQAACKRAISGAASTHAEMQQMLEHIMASLDTGPSGPAGVQVTLAMRRLRETVHEIVESAMCMPGAKEASIEITPSIAPKPIPMTTRPISRQAAPPTKPPGPQPPPKPLNRKNSLLTDPKDQEEVEQSIADAKATAPDVAVPTQQELVDMAGELERNVHLIGQLHSKRTTNLRKTVRFRTGEPNSSENAPPPITSGPPPSPAAVASIVDSTEGLDSVILACQHVVHTTLSLMYWAAAAQRELVQQGRLKPVDMNHSGTDTESQFSQGLISAARYVAAAANCVVESAQEMVAIRVSSLDGSDPDANPTPKPDALISAAQTTAACTAQLIVACMAKADPRSKSFIGLRQAGSEVKSATEHLVKLVQSFSGQKGTNQTEPSQDSLEGFGASMVASMREVIETKSSIAAKQRELESLHIKLKHINQDQYKGHDE